jgi:PAS domain S-box-containing protein
MPSGRRHPASEGDAILAAALDAVITIDEDGSVVELNPAAEKIFGYGRHEALGRPVSELVIPPELRAAQRAGLERVRSGGPSRILGRRVELTAMRADGGEFPVEVAVARTGQAPPRFTAWIRDLSERKAVEAESIRRKVLLDRAERVAQIGSWEWTPATGELLWSNNLSRLFGLEPGELAPSLQVLVDRTHPDDQPKLERELESAKRGGTLPPLDLRVVRPDRSVRHLRAARNVSSRLISRSRRRWPYGTRSSREASACSATSPPPSNSRSRRCGCLAATSWWPASSAPQGPSPSPSTSVSPASCDSR